MRALLVGLLAIGFISCDDDDTGCIADCVVDVTSYTPTSSPAAGGGTLTAVGNDIDDLASITIGGNDCTSLTVVDTGTVTCTIPPGTAATTVEVHFVDSTGNRKEFVQNAFIYN